MIYIIGVYHQEDAMATAKVFWNGRSQAVRLPKEFRFDTDTVSISRQGDRVILEPVAKDWDWLGEVIGRLDDDALAAAGEPVPDQERPELDDLFR